jgi:hypothetical protein
MRSEVFEVSAIYLGFMAFIFSREQAPGAESGGGSALVSRPWSHSRVAWFANGNRFNR